jgi:hypothetical protein
MDRTHLMVKNYLQNITGCMNNNSFLFLTGKLAKGKSAVKCQQVEFYCLRKLENPIRIPGDEEEIKLANASLGSNSKVIDVPLDHSSREMQQLILS